MRLNTQVVLNLVSFFSPDGRSFHREVVTKPSNLQELATVSEIRTFKGHAWTVTSVAFSPDGEFIVSGSQDETVKLRNIDTGWKIKTFEGHTLSVDLVSFSLDGKFIALGSNEGIVNLWETGTGRLLRSIYLGPILVKPLSAVFSPSGKLSLVCSHLQLGTERGVIICYLNW